MLSSWKPFSSFCLGLFFFFFGRSYFRPLLFFFFFFKLYVRVAVLTEQFRWEVKKTLNALLQCLLSSRPFVQCWVCSLLVLFVIFVHFGFKWLFMSNFWRYHDLWGLWRPEPGFGRRMRTPQPRRVWTQTTAEARNKQAAAGEILQLLLLRKRISETAARWIPAWH